MKKKGPQGEGSEGGEAHGRRGGKDNMDGHNYGPIAMNAERDLQKAECWNAPDAPLAELDGLDLELIDGIKREMLAELNRYREFLKDKPDTVHDYAERFRLLVYQITALKRLKELEGRATQEEFPLTEPAPIR